MPTKRKNSGASWKNERASISKRNSSKPRSNKYRSVSDSKKRQASGSVERYWRAGSTRRDGTRVKGHYVNKSG